MGYWEPAKLVAKLRALKTDTRLLVLKTEMGAGHFSVTGRFEKLKEVGGDLQALHHCRWFRDNVLLITSQGNWDRSLLWARVTVDLDAVARQRSILYNPSR